MIKERKPRMTYTYFNRRPNAQWCTTHLFSFGEYSVPGMVRVPFPTMYVDLSAGDFTEQWSSSAKRKIKKAAMDQMAIDRGVFLLKDVLKLFNQSAGAKGLRGYKTADFDSKKQIEVSAIYSDGVILCGHVWLIDESEKRALLYVNASGHVGGHNNSTMVGRAHYYLLWQDGVYLKNKGIHTMDLMGYDPTTSNPRLAGVYQWKAATHGVEEVLYHYYPIWFYVLRKFRNMLSR